MARFEPSVDWTGRAGTDYKLVSTERLNNGESRLHLICKDCGREKQLSTITLRTKGRVGKCEYCDRVRRSAEKKLAELDKKIRKDKQRAKERIKTRQIGLRFCSCGALLGYRQSVCNECKHDNLKETYRRKDVVRRARIRTVTKDKGITLRKLYERDNGVCYLCGRVCDWNDCRWDGRTFIVGKNYPTVEHLVPIVQGGSDTWANIRLACLSCNSKKGGRAIA